MAVTTSTASSAKSGYNPTTESVSVRQSFRKPNLLTRTFRFLVQAIDSDYFPGGPDAQLNKPDRFEFRRFVPFLILHIGCLGVIWTGWSWTAVLTAFLLYVIRMFFVTGIYHRYFCHKSFDTSRVTQFILGLLALTSVQRGPLWWAAVHRHHHAYSDEEPDVHSPGLRGFWWAHIGWMTSERNYPTNYKMVKDLAKYPELVFLNRFDLIGPFALLVFLYGLGSGLNWFFPSLQTSGAQMVVWGFFISTVCVFHATCSINSFSHLMGSQRYQTRDDSRNSLILALLTLGEGWHNNHHRFQKSARQGFYWWEIDITYYILFLLSKTGLIWNLRAVPETAYTEASAVQKNPS